MGRAREVSVRRWIAVVWAVLCAVGLVATWLLSTGADGGKEAAAEAKREAELQQKLAAQDAEHCADMYYGDNFDTQAESSPGVLHIGPGYPSYAPDDRRMLDGLTPQMLAACRKAFPRCDISFNMPCETTAAGQAGLEVDAALYGIARGGRARLPRTPLSVRLTQHR